MTETTAIIPIETTSPLTEANICSLVSQMDSESLGQYVASAMVGILSKVESLRPYYEELWRRFDALKDGETICGCGTRTEYCQKVLHRSMRSVQYVLYGRPPIKDYTEPSELDAPENELSANVAGNLDAPPQPPDAPAPSHPEYVGQPRKINPNFNRAGTRGYKDKPHLNTFLRRLMAISAVGTTSPFPKAADYAFKECPREAAKAVIVNLDLAIGRLKEYRKKFEGVQNA